MIYYLITTTFLILTAWFYFLYLVYKEQKTSVRGIIKKYNYGNLGTSLNKIIKIWLLIFIALFFVTLAWVVYFAWRTDYNFLIAIYPFVWHYMFFRYFLWEKEDLLDYPQKNN
ncbi:MAG: hypothetical protein OEV78_06535 [Spirochaetia bacterium]|nr:hypothetical protein [Spirochaetia bacterium]